MFEYRIHDRVRLKLLESRHAKALFTLINDNWAHLGRWLPFVQETKSIQDSLRFIDKALEQFYHDNGFHAGLWFGERLIGVAGFHYMEWHARKTSLGYWLSEQFEGHGYMTEACRALINYAFYERQLNRIEAKVPPGNRKSCALAERLGFQKEGCLRAAERLNGQFIDLAVFGLLKKDWAGE